MGAILVLLVKVVYKLVRVTIEALLVGAVVVKVGGKGLVVVVGCVSKGNNSLIGLVSSAPGLLSSGYIGSNISISRRVSTYRLTSGSKGGVRISS